MEKIPVTKKGYDAMEVDLRQLKTVDRPAIIQAISEARAHGDLKENAEYHAAKEKQGFIEARIKDLEARIGAADIIDISKLTPDRVKFGCIMTLVDEETDEEISYQILSEYEADLEKKIIAINAPIAKAAIGKKIGDSIEVITPKGEKFYEVLKIEIPKE
jgi:transcription elongation factor GreA